MDEYCTNGTASPRYVLLLGGRARPEANEIICVKDRQKLGLPLHPQESVMIGRIVNQDWYEGYLPNDLNKYGFIPRNYVKIES